MEGSNFFQEKGPLHYNNIIQLLDEVEQNIEINDLPRRSVICIEHCTDASLYVANRVQ